MALLRFQTLKGRATTKMESNSKVENKVKLYPVDRPVENYGELSKGYDEYLSSVLSDGAVNFTLSNGNKVEVTCDNIGRLTFLQDDDLSHFILALHTSEDETQVVAVLLQGKWWTVGDVLKTSNESRNGLVLVESVMERVVLFLLSQVIFGILEKPFGEDLYFSAYSLREHGKILWKNGEAVGFYTVKKKGSLCDGCTGQSYQLPVLDTVFVRSRWRRTGLALQMLEDFCSSQPSEGILGISFPMTHGMYGVCQKYLEVHHEERDRLYEVEAPGEWAQRRNVWLNIQMRDLPQNCGNSEQSPHSSYCHERNKAGSEEEGIPTQCGSSVSHHKRSADQDKTGSNFKKSRTD